MNEPDAARRRLLTQAAALPVLLALPLLAKTSAAQAGQGSKEDFHYQDHPNEGKQCANCVQFVAPEAGQQFGSCRILAGPIMATGWCMAFTPK
jgi:hypothetical protein